MAVLEEIKQIYGDYVERIATLRRDSRATDGLLGMGGGPAADSCNDRFVEALRVRLDATAGEDLSDGELKELLEYIYHVPLEYREDRVIYWMLLAVHGMTGPLVRRLTSATAEDLLQEYQKWYRPFERLPAQKDILRALNGRARAGELVI